MPLSRLLRALVAVAVALPLAVGSAVPPCAHGDGAAAAAVATAAADVDPCHDAGGAPAGEPRPAACKTGCPACAAVLPPAAPARPGARVAAERRAADDRHPGVPAREPATPPPRA